MNESRSDHRDEVSGPEFWEAIYRDKPTPPWDAGVSAPALVALLDGRGPVALPVGDNTRVAVPGCGLGHDLVTFAQHGFEAVGFDIAQQAIEGARALLAERGLSGEVVDRDIFTLGVDPEERYGIIYEYTCFCAISPDRRAEYAEAIKRALAPGGLLIALFFPYGESFPAGGPPFPVREGELETHFEAGFEWLYCGAPSASHPRREGLERLLIARLTPR